MAVNFSALNTVYNHYLTSYAPKGTTSLDTHKKSELRNIYNNIIKLNKEAPLSIVDNSAEARKYAVDLKKQARSFQNTMASLSTLDENKLLNQKTAYSQNEDVVLARFIGQVPDDGQEVPSFEIEVQSLASSQVNMGNFLDSDARAKLAPGLYSFDIGINDMNYEFQFSINEGDTNASLQERLGRLITNSNIGLHAGVLEDGMGYSSLRLSSVKTGAVSGKENLFTVSDFHTSQRSGSVSYLGIGDVSRPASNARFTVNGAEKECSSNNFTLENMYELTLQGLTPESSAPVTVGLKNDTDSLAENIESLISEYNNFLDTSASYAGSHPRSGILTKEMNRLTQDYLADLSSIGISADENGHLGLDRTQLESSLSGETTSETFLSVNDFARSVYQKTNQVALNPMNYVEKTIVAYKNPGKSFASPYITSAYTGMLFNSYC